MDRIPSKYREFESFYRALLALPPTALTAEHLGFLRAIGIDGDAARADWRIEEAEMAADGSKIVLGQTWGYRHTRAFNLNPGPALVRNLLSQVRRTLGLPHSAPVVVADTMAGRGTIPLEAIRYGFKVYANDLNPVAAVVLKATLEYPSRFSKRLLPHLAELSAEVRNNVARRLERFFPAEPVESWWQDLGDAARRKFLSKSVHSVEPGVDQPIRRNTFLWMRSLPCAKCGLKIPLSTNLTLSRKGPAAGHLAVFPEVPARGADTECRFKIVPRTEWPSCRWPTFGAGDSFDPTATLTYRDGTAVCPRCGDVIDGDSVKRAAKATPGGLASQLYAVSCRVPVKLTYKNGEVKYRYLWRFRAPTPADLEAARSAKEELDRLTPRWGELIPREEVPAVMEDKRPRE